jgi:hypothetical protein
MFRVSLYHGLNNSIFTERGCFCSSPADAAKRFLSIFFPLDKIYLPLRYEPAEKNNDEIIPVWSVGTTASGQRMFIKEV